MLRSNEEQMSDTAEKLTVDEAELHFQQEHVMELRATDRAGMSGRV